MWIAIVALAAVVAGAVLWMARTRGSAARGSRQPAGQWREPEGARELFVLFAAVGEVATTTGAGKAWITVDWSWGRNRDDAVALCYWGGEEPLPCRDARPGQYLAERMDAEHRMRREFHFAVASGGAPRCFRSGNDALALLHSFAPHAYVDEEYAEHFCIRFREHTAAELPKEYSGPNGLESVILRRFGQR